MGDLSFYRNKDRFLLRNKTSMDKNRIQNDPAFKRTRENGQEFGTIAAAGKLLREANAVLIRKAYDGSLSNRLMQVFAKVKNSDLGSLRGQRQVYEGLATAEGKTYMKGFDFNSRATLRGLLAAPYVLDLVTGSVSITDLVPAELLAAPPHATHVSMQAAVLHVDFAGSVSEIAYSTVETLKLDMTVSSPVLTPTAVPVATGNLFYLFLVEFMQEVNGVQYALNNGNYNSLTVLEVM